MAKTIEQLRAETDTIYNETVAKKNDATRVGGTLGDMVDKMEVTEENVGSLQTDITNLKAEDVSIKSRLDALEDNEPHEVPLDLFTNVTVSGDSKTAWTANSTSGVGIYHTKVWAGDVVKVVPGAKRAIIYFTSDETLVADATINFANGSTSGYSASTTTNYNVTEDCYLCIGKYLDTNTLNRTPSSVTVNNVDWNERTHGGNEQIAQLQQEIDDLTISTTNADNALSARITTNTNNIASINDKLGEVPVVFYGNVTVSGASKTQWKANSTSGVGFWLSAVKAGDVVRIVPGAKRAIFYFTSDESLVAGATINMANGASEGYAPTTATNYNVSEDCYLAVGKYLDSDSNNRTPSAILVNGVDWTQRSILGDIEGLKESSEDHETRITALEQGSEESKIPSYYTADGYLDNIASKIRTAFNNCSNNSATFMFFTDAHLSTQSTNWVSVLRYLSTKTPIHKVLFGGDITSGYNIKNMYYNWVNKIENSLNLNSLDYYPTRGNHDMWGADTSTNPSVGYADRSHAIPLLFSTVTKKKGVEWNTLDEGRDLSYYFDEPISKTRYLCCDFSDRGNNDTIKAQHRTWVANVLKSIPDNWGLVVMNHYNIVPALDSITQQTSKDEVSSFYKAILEACINKGTYNGTTFTSTLTYIVHVSGHQHTDMQTFCNGIVHIGSLACNPRHTPFNDGCLGDYATYPSRADGAKSEISVDSIVISDSNKVVSCIKTGWGYDRFFKFTPIRIAIGATAELTATLISDVTHWSAYDADANICGMNTQDSWTNTRVTVAENVVTGVSAGESVVFAMNANRQKEFFYVIVEQP